MSENIEFDPVDHITVGALGEPGDRTFVIQATQGEKKVSLIIEKAHVIALAQQAQELFATAGPPEPLPKWDADFMALDADIEPAWRVGTAGIGYTEETEQILLICNELVPEEEEEGATARFWLTKTQLATLAGYGMVVVSQGRPLCPLCRHPMNPDSHYCVALNGKEGPER